jgi:hypothetical protein
VNRQRTASSAALSARADSHESSPPRGAGTLIRFLPLFKNPVALYRVAGF